MLGSFWTLVTNVWTALLPPGSLYARFARGAFWSLVGTAIAQGLSIVSSVVVARMLGKVGYGELGMINSTVGMFGVFAGLGLGLTATKYVAEFRSKDPDRAGRILGLSELAAVVSGGTVSLILFALAPILAEHTLNAPHLVNELRLGCGLLFLNALVGVQTGALAGFEAFGAIARVNLWRGLFNFLMIIVGVQLFGLMGAVAATVIVGILGWWLNQRALRKEYSKWGVIVTIGEWHSELSVLWGFALPAFLSSLPVGPAMWLANTLLVTQPGGYGELGAYNAVMQVKRALEFVLLTFMNPLLPMLSEQYGKADNEAYSKSLFFAFCISTGLLGPLALFLIAAPDLVLLPYGQDFAKHRVLAQWLLIHTLLVALFAPLGSVVPSMGRMWFGFAYNLSWGLLFLSLSYFLIPLYLANGMAVAFVLTHAITSLLSFGYIYVFERRFLVGFPLMKVTIGLFVLSALSMVARGFLPIIWAGIVGTMCGSEVVVFLMVSLRRHGVRIERYIPWRV